MFTHLHLHTEYSLLDGVTRISDLVNKLKETGMNSCALTDHGSMYGIFKFYSEMKKAELKPILGCEIYIAPRRRDQKEHGIDNKYFHQTVLAMNLQGYKNLVKLVSIGHMEGYYYKPRVDWETLEKYSEGLIVLSGCLQGVVAKPLQSDDYKTALANAKQYSELFKDRFFIEIQRNGIEEQVKVNEGLIKISKELNLPLVATCDAHYLNKEDAEVQEVLWAIADGKTLEDPTRRTSSSNEFYVKTPEEMKELFKDIPEAIENTQKISDMVENYEITFGRIEPQYLDLPKGKEAKEQLKELAYEGAEKLYGKISKELKTRIDYELEVIHDKGYDHYFLVVQMIVNFCRENDIVVSMRGSGTGSVVAYSIGITSIDPIGWELYFERFLNPERKSAPDFDIDLEDRQRDKVIDFIIQKYGEDSVKQIVTFSKLQTRQAIRDVSRVLGIDLVTADKLSKLVEILFGKSKSIDYMIENNPEFAEIINSTDQLKRMANIVRKISGLARGVSKHACGLVIAPEPVDNYVPVQRDSHNEGLGITQYEFMQLEDVGLMKFDLLGLKNLNVIGGALKKIKDSKNETIDLIKLDYTDKKAFDVIQKCETVGVFQMESDGMKRTLRNIYPETMEDICYILAAYRPGPMQFIPQFAAVKHGEKEAEYIIPELEPILKVTNGVITYQEQVIRIAVDIAGYTMGEADALRKAMGKKILEVMEAEKPKFIEGAVERGHDRKKIEELWKLLELFANYGFNKAHSAMYATVSFWTAYLKGHYPLEFMAALLESDLEKFERVILDMDECTRLGFKVLPPAINKSNYYFTIEGESNIRFGMAAIKNVGKDIIKAIVSEREGNGQYLSLDDFIIRNIDNKLQQRALEYLIMCGALDEFGDRQAMLSILPQLMDSQKKQKQIRDLGQIDFFNQNPTQTESITISSVSTQLPADIKTPVHKILEWEKELLGLYFSSHPLDNLQEFFAAKDVVTIRELKDKKNRALIVLGGLITNVKRITTKKGERMAFLTVEDKTGNTDVIVFPRTYEEMKDSFEPNKPMLIAGRINERDGERSVVLEKAKYIDLTKFSENFDGIVFKLKDSQSEDDLAELREFIKDNPGDTPVKILMKVDGELKSILLKHKISLEGKASEYIQRFS